MVVGQFPNPFRNEELTHDPGAGRRIE